MLLYGLVLIVVMLVSLIAFLFFDKINFNAKEKKLKEKLSHLRPKPNFQLLLAKPGETHSWPRRKDTITDLNTIIRSNLKLEKLISNNPILTQAIPHVFKHTPPVDFIRESMGLLLGIIQDCKIEFYSNQKEDQSYIKIYDIDNNPDFYKNDVQKKIETSFGVYKKLEQGFSFVKSNEWLESIYYPFYKKNLRSFLVIHYRSQEGLTYKEEVLYKILTFIEKIYLYLNENQGQADLKKMSKELLYRSLNFFNQGFYNYLSGVDYHLLAIKVKDQQEKKSPTDYKKMKQLISKKIPTEPPWMFEDFDSFEFDLVFNKEQNFSALKSELYSLLERSFYPESSHLEFEINHYPLNKLPTVKRA